MVTLGQIGRMVTLRWAFPRSGLVAFGFALVGMLLLSQLIPRASDRIADFPWLTMLLQLSVLLLCGGIGIVFWVPLQSNQKYALAVAWLSLFLVAAPRRRKFSIANRSSDLEGLVVIRASFVE